MGEAARKKRNGRDLALADCATRVVQAISDDDALELAEASIEFDRWQVSIFDVELCIQSGAIDRSFDALSLAAVVGAPACARWLVAALDDESVQRRNVQRAMLFAAGAMDWFENPRDARQGEALETCARLVASGFEEDGLPKATLVALHEAACESRPRFAAFLAGYVARADARELDSDDSILGGEREPALRL